MLSKRCEGIAALGRACQWTGLLRDLAEARTMPEGKDQP